MKRCFSLILIALMVCSVPFAVCASEGAFLVMDGVTGDVLEQENGNLRLPMASTTKVMTALVVLESVALEEVVVIPKEAAGVEGTSLYVKAGEKYTVEQLLYALMLQSANDCAVALAWYVGNGDPAAFVVKMNEKARDIGLKDTAFANPSGLPAENHYTTARELALMMAEAMKNETFRAITAAKSYTIGDKTVVNHNKLLKLYPACIGGKTGYTVEAGRCLVSVAEREGAPLFCVTLGRRDDWNIHMAAYEKWFSRLSSVTVAEKGSFVTKLPIAGGGTVEASNSQTVTANLFSYNGDLSTRVLADAFIYGNRKVGDVVGTVEFWYRHTKIGESPLVCHRSVEVEVKKDLFIARIFAFFRRIFLKKT